MAAIRSALTDEKEGFHVLHLSCHARPGELILETEDGEEDPVKAKRLLEEALPAGVDLPMVVLSGCSTGLEARTARERGHGTSDEGSGRWAQIATDLLAAAVPAVLAMQAPVSDRYATELVAGVYGYLATADEPDPLAALSDARRRVEQARQELPVGVPGRVVEWATPALWVRGLRLPLFSRREEFGEIAPPRAPVLAEGIVVRKVGEFVGRRGELRELRRALRGSKAGAVIHGIGGVGKSTLAAETIVQTGEQLVVSLREPLRLMGLLTSSARG